MASISVPYPYPNLMCYTYSASHHCPTQMLPRPALLVFEGTTHTRVETTRLQRTKRQKIRPTHNESRPEIRLAHNKSQSHIVRTARHDETQETRSEV